MQYLPDLKHPYEPWRIPEAVIERDDVLAWFLIGLAGIDSAKFWHSKVARPCEVAHLRTIGFRKTWNSHSPVRSP